MAIAISLYNGLNIGLERTKNKPMWGLDAEGQWDVIGFTGFVFHLACFRISIGSFFDLEDFE